MACPPKVSKFDKDKLLELINSGMSFTEISVIFGSCPQYIGRLASAYGFKKPYKAIGRRFDKLVVLSEIGYFENHRKYKCLCDCGRTCIKSSSTLYGGRGQISCGCVRQGEYQGIPQKYWGKVICRARNANMELSITKQYAGELFNFQNGKCALSGFELDFIQRVGSYGTASLDRIDSSKGYVEGNVQWIHKDINIMKMDLPEYKFLDYCHAISEFNIYRLI